MIVVITISPRAYDAVLQIDEEKIKCIRGY